MRKPDNLANLLPYSFANGTIISRFAKRCPHCKNTVESSAMLGQFVILNDLLFVAATAECNACKHSFHIACTINNQRKIKESLMPWWLLNACLSRAMPRFRVLPNSENSALLVDAQNAIDLSGILNLEEVTEATHLLGCYDGISIPEWIEHNGCRMDFVRVVPRNIQPQLKDCELLYRQHLVFSSTSA